ncbi:hypothetical protein NL676_007265 [Syzygium grande]|nr:hypothetical protein NL676_007265 [Syzygium grande]
MTRNPALGSSRDRPPSGIRPPTPRDSIAKPPAEIRPPTPKIATPAPTAAPIPTSPNWFQLRMMLIPKWGGIVGDFHEDRERGLVGLQTGRDLRVVACLPSKERPREGSHGWRWERGGHEAGAEGGLDPQVDEAVEGEVGAEVGGGRGLVGGGAGLVAGLKPVGWRRRSWVAPSLRRLTGDHMTSSRIGHPGRGSAP